MKLELKEGRERGEVGSGRTVSKVVGSELFRCFESGLVEGGDLSGSRGGHDWKEERVMAEGRKTMKRR